MLLPLILLCLLLPDPSSWLIEAGNWNLCSRDRSRQGSQQDLVLHSYTIPELARICLSGFELSWSNINCGWKIVKVSEHFNFLLPEIGVESRRFVACLGKRLIVFKTSERSSESTIR